MPWVMTWAWSSWTPLYYYPSLILFLKHKFMVYPGFWASVLVQWTCCPCAVNCNCCWVMLSPCLAFFSSRVPQFWHWYYDAYMTQTAHQWMVRVLWPNIPVCMWHVETKYRHLLQILYLSQYQCINWGTLLSCHFSVKLSRQWATQRGLGAADLLELELFHSMSVFSSP